MHSGFDVCHTAMEDFPVSLAAPIAAEAIVAETGTRPVTVVRARPAPS